MIYEKRLESGARMIGEYLPHFRSISFGVWFGTGSVKEVKGEDGLSHFLEHMLFKGTERRSASDIASEMDGLFEQFDFAAFQIGHFEHVIQKSEQLNGRVFEFRQKAV